MNEILFIRKKKSSFEGKIIILNYTNPETFYIKINHAALSLFFFHFSFSKLRKLSSPERIILKTFNANEK